MSEDAELDEIQRVAAVATAMAVCVLAPCAKHRNIVLRVADANTQDAYDYAEKMFAAGHLDGLFGSHDELRAAMRAAIADHPNSHCELCEPIQTN